MNCSGLYDEAEIDRAKALDLSASEIVQHEQEEHRMRIVGAMDSVTVTWGDGFALENVPYGQFADRAMEFINNESPEVIRKWRDANRAGLQTFWAKHPGDALELKRQIEARLNHKEAAE